MYWWQQSIKWDTTFFLKDSLLFEWIHVRHLVLNREWYEGKTARAAEGRPERRGWDTNTSKDRKQLRVWSNAQKNEISYHFYIGKWLTVQRFLSVNSQKTLAFSQEILQFWNKKSPGWPIDLGGQITSYFDTESQLCSSRWEKRLVSRDNWIKTSGHPQYEICSCGWITTLFEIERVWSVLMTAENQVRHDVLLERLLVVWIEFTVRHLVLNREWHVRRDSEGGRRPSRAQGMIYKHIYRPKTAKASDQMLRKLETSCHFYIGKWYSSEIFVLNSWKRLSFFPQILQFWTTNQQDRSNGQQITCISTQNKLFLVNARKDLHPDTIESRPRCTHSMRYVLVAEWLPHRDRTSEKCIDDSRVSSETRRSSWKTPYCLNEFM